MVGCYGSDPEDRYFENKLINHLDKYDEIPTCGICGKEMETGDPDDRDCGGDCWECIKEHEQEICAELDPECGA